MQKTCEHCGNDSTGEKYEVHQRSSEQILEILYCLRDLLEHQFAKYSGTAYEIDDYVTRTQDPRDPGDVYMAGSLYRGTQYHMGLRSCIYEQALRYGNTWTSHELFCKLSLEDLELSTRGSASFQRNDVCDQAAVIIESSSSPETPALFQPAGIHQISRFPDNNIVSYNIICCNYMGSCCCSVWPSAQS